MGEEAVRGRYLQERKRFDIRSPAHQDLGREKCNLRKVNEILKLASALFAQTELDRHIKS